MTLGDTIWVKRLQLSKNEYRYKDTVALQNLAKKKFDLDLSFAEAYLLWDTLSTRYSAGWLVYSIERATELLEELFDE